MRAHRAQPRYRGKLAINRVIERQAAPRILSTGSAAQATRQRVFANPPAGLGSIVSVRDPFTGLYYKIVGFYYVGGPQVIG